MKTNDILVGITIAFILMAVLFLYNLGKQSRPYVLYLRNENGVQTEMWSALRENGIELDDVQKKAVEDTIKTNPGRRKTIGF
jgi:hypothetical protein